MNFILKFIIVFIIFFSCKKNVYNTKMLQSNYLTQKEIKPEQKTAVSFKDSIKVFHVYYDSIAFNKTERITAINKRLHTHFLEYQFNKGSNELRNLKNIKELSKSRGFLNTLTKDFKNKSFKEVSSIHYSYLEPLNDKYSSRISIEEWYFKDKQKAKYCFESLKKYEEAIIHFKTINWIWIYQDNKIFLVFALDHQVLSKEMQHIKQEIINEIKHSGTYDSVQFYE